MRHRLANDIELDLWAVVSDEDPHLESHKEHLDKNGFQWIAHSNELLWQKWKALMKHVQLSYNWESPHNLGVLVMGSDDIATAPFVELGAMMLKYGAPCVQPTGCIMFHPETGRMSYIEAFNGGAGRFFHRDVLVASDFALWQQNTDFSSVDLYQQYIMKEYGIEAMPCTPDTPWAMMDIKSEWNMWDWDQFSPDVNIITKWLNGPAVIDKHFPYAFEATNDIGTSGLPDNGRGSLPESHASAEVDIGDLSAN
jgi:hypothetical protein